MAVVGGGILGLATAYALTLARPGLRLAVLEKEAGFAAHQTGRNSGVIHSGVYYRPGSYKARFAVAGAAELVAFCREHGIPYEVTDKLVVATGICDFPAVATAYARLAREAGAELRPGSEVLAAARRRDGVTLRTSAGELRCRVLVNCAGLHSDRIARLAGDDAGVRIVPFRGEYYELAERRRDLVRGLVYPVPDPAFPFLGVHLTRGVHGDVHVGPNAVPALAREGYDWRTVRPRDLAGTLAFPGTWRIARRHWRYELGELHRSLSKRAFTTAVRRLLPAVAPEDLVPAAAGVRAQAVARDGSLLDDFAFAGFDPDDPRSPRRAVHVLNAPSPAATASLPIGREVARRALAALEAGG
ncbi:L-2-hydroxyglutarate oxidase [Kitasatospora sp. NPDC101235]|uniref:L-2-hydroxyglutarate oxidase n=1 Tax=Kitasatospora sp. NPDC101235 TaxID=3364101 RepID=UPI003801BB94